MVKVDGFDTAAMVKVDGFDTAVIGFTHLWNLDGFVIVYDAKKIIDTLMERDEMPYEDAVEYFEINIQGAYVGPHTPLFMFSADLEELKELSEALDG